MKKRYQSIASVFGLAATLCAGAPAVAQVENCPKIGNVCSDGTLFVGENAAGRRLFTTAENAPVALPWNDGDRRWAFVGFGRTESGKFNTLALADSRFVDIESRAAEYCANLEKNGHGDWYLPSPGEMRVLYESRSLIGNFENASETRYWTSFEESNMFATTFDIDGGIEVPAVKSTKLQVRCMR